MFHVLFPLLFDLTEVHMGLVWLRNVEGENSSMNKLYLCIRRSAECRELIPTPGSGPAPARRIGLG